MSNLAALIILDGFACRSEEKGNAVSQAHKPNFDRYWNQYPHNMLHVSGEDVGLPDGQMGNSEVGHLNIGAGRIVYQSLTRINKAIEDKSFFENQAFLKAIKQVKEHDKALHLYGLLSDGGVHSHINHLFALLELAKRHEVKEVYVHAFLDGRDVDQKSALIYLDQLNGKMTELGIGQLATISGRFYAMDRDQRWPRVKLAYDAIRYGEGHAYKDYRQVIHDAYEKEIYDEFVEPSVIINEQGNPVGTVNDGDAIIFYNFRPDRAIQLSKAFANEDFDDFVLGKNKLKDIYFVQMTPYSEDVEGDIAYRSKDLHETLGEVIANNDLKQLRIAETEKFPHVTYFMSGGREEPFEGEKRILIDSPKVATYDLKPEMSAYEVTESLLTELDRDDLSAVILNFANPDMVGHSGMLEPTIKAIEAVDECLGKIVDKIISQGGEVIITADHGNSDEVVTLDGEPMTTHTTNPVPVIVTKDGIAVRDGGRLADLAPTMLELLELKQPEEMTGKSLISQK